MGASEELPHGEHLSCCDCEGRPPHVLIFPYPLQSHVTPMLKLAEVLSLSRIRVTFLNTDRNQRRLLSSASVRARLAGRPGLHLRCIPHVLPDDNPRDIGQAVEMVKEFDAAAQPRFREILSSGGAEGEPPPVTCVVADGLIRLALDVAEELGVPIVAFRTSSAFSFWADHCITGLIATGAQHSTTHGCDLDERVGCVPGSESFLRRRDLPSFCRTNDGMGDPLMQLVTERTKNVARYRGVILNTAEFAEASFLARIRGQVQSSIYPVGPLHGLLQTVENLTGAGAGADGRDDEGVLSFSKSTSLWQEDSACMEWLDARPPASVVYVSFGSVAVLEREQLVELWHGLVNCGYHFLLVARPGLVAHGGWDSGGAPAAAGTEERGLLVEWAPQQEVLGHPAVGCFLTHGGWNSTLEGMWAAVPMVCWPNFGDQHVNSRFVSEVWRVGVEIEDACVDRAAVEKAVREVMGGGERSSEMRITVSGISELAREEVKVGGSSYMNLERLIQDIRTMSSRRYTVKLVDNGTMDGDKAQRPQR